MISVCIITRNEAHHLEECLKRLRPTGFEIVVVDTGSEDNSIEVAEKYTDAVYQFEWCDDFSAARNYSISKATNDWILVLDSDEYLEKYTFNKIKRLIEEYPERVGRIQRKSEYFSNGNRMISNEILNRFFDRRYYCYNGKIHEQVVTLSGNYTDFDTFEVPIEVYHTGYSGDEAERKKKAERNLRLLFIELDENPGDAYISYQIGKSYYYIQEYTEAARYFEMAMENSTNVRLEYVADMVVMYGYALLNTQQAGKALMLEGLYDDFCKSADYLFVMALIYMQNGKFDLAVELFLGAAKCPSCTVVGVNSYLSWYNIGVIYECLGDKKNALYFYRKCGGYEPAKLGISRVM